MGLFDWFGGKKEFVGLPHDLEESAADAQPVIRRSEVVLRKRGIVIKPDDGGDTIWDAESSVVPNVLLDRNLTREQIKDVVAYHNQFCLSKPPLPHPEHDTCPPHAVLMERVENLFLATDQRHFDYILAALSRRFSDLKLEWKYGVMHVNGAKTKIRCSGIDKAYEVLRKLGTADSVEDFLVDLISRQLQEIFVG